MLRHDDRCLPRPTSQTRLSRRGALRGAVAAVTLGLPTSRFVEQARAAAPSVPFGAVTWVQYNLNSATAAQLMGIPGADERTVRALLTQRPYRSITQAQEAVRQGNTASELSTLVAYLFVPVDSQQADAATLQQLPGVTAEIAAGVIAARPYADTAAFLHTLRSEISPELLAAATTFLAPDAGATASWLKYNLNTASDAQLLAIPGVDEAMARAFAASRPYSSIAQFRTELTAINAAADLASLERYLFVPVDPGQADLTTLAQLPGVSTDVAWELLSEGPFRSGAALQAALQTTLTPELAAVATTYLAGA